MNNIKFKLRITGSNLTGFRNMNKKNTKVDYNRRFEDKIKDK